MGRPAAGVSRCAGVAAASPRSSAPRPSERAGGGRGRGRAVWARRGPVRDGNRIRVSQAKRVIRVTFPDSLLQHEKL